MTYPYIKLHGRKFTKDKNERTNESANDMCLRTDMNEATEDKNSVMLPA
jgi:hypothetical protein